jgi:hypothetical protein
MVQDRSENVFCEIESIYTGKFEGCKDGFFFFTRTTDDPRSDH